MWLLLWCATQTTIKPTGFAAVTTVTQCHQVRCVVSPTSGLGADVVNVCCFLALAVLTDGMRLQERPANGPPPHTITALMRGWTTVRKGGARWSVGGWFAGHCRCGVWLWGMVVFSVGTTNNIIPVHHTTMIPTQPRGCVGMLCVIVVVGRKW